MRSYWLLLLGLASACGRVESFADAQVNEVDAQVDATPSGIATVEVLSSDGSPSVGATAIFVDPDGTVVGTPVTDAKGSASATIRIGATVTVIVRSTSGGKLTTVVGIEPGDVVRIGTKSRPGATPAGEAILAFTPYSGALSYRLETPCSEVNIQAGTATTITAPYHSGCIQDTFDYALVASTAAGDQAFVTLTGVAKGNATFPNNWRSMPAMTATYSGVPSNVTGITVDRGLFSKGRSVDTQRATATPTPGDSTLLVSVPSAFLIGDQMRVSTSMTTAIGGQTQGILEPLLPGSTYGLKLSDEVLPWLSGLQITPATRTITYKQEGPGAAGVAVVNLDFSRTVNETTSSFQWMIIAAPASGTLVFPDLPDDAAGTAELRATDTVRPSGVFQLRMQGLTYKELRQSAAALSEFDISLPKLAISQFSCGRTACR